MSGPPPSKSQHCRKAMLGIARKGAQVLWKGLRIVSVAVGVANLVRNEDAASLAQTVLTAFIEL